MIGFMRHEDGDGIPQTFHFMRCDFCATIYEISPDQYQTALDFRVTEMVPGQKMLDECYECVVRSKASQN